MTHVLLTMILICMSLVASSECIGANISTEEDVAVLSAIVTNRCEYATARPDKRYNVLSAQASVVEQAPSNGNLDPGLVESLVLRNSTAHDLPPLALCPAYKLVPQAKIEAAMDKKGWRGFHKAFPKASGVAYLSLPGYSADGARAIVQVSVSCGRLCGNGCWVMRKVAGKWTLQKSVSGWIS